MSRYKSLGTLRYRLSSGKSGGKTKIKHKMIFIPAAERLAQHDGKKYAIFIGGKVDSKILDAKLRKYKPEINNGIELSVSDTLKPIS